MRGGDLFNQLVKVEHFSEAEAVVLSRQVADSPCTFEPPFATVTVRLSTDSMSTDRFCCSLLARKRRRPL